MTEHPPAGYEASDVPPKWVALTGLGLALLTVLVALGAGALVVHFNRHAGGSADRSALERERLIPPEPRLQTDPEADADAYEAQMNEELATYAWIDRERGIVRIPIAKAMQQLAQRGWPQPTADSGIDPSPAPNAPRTAR
jgi:hypothetical protein